LSGIFDPAIFDLEIFDVEAAATVVPIPVELPGAYGVFTPEYVPPRRHRHLELFDLDEDLYAARLSRAA
jgi:hypothetical protein